MVQLEFHLGGQLCSLYYFLGKRCSVHRSNFASLIGAAALCAHCGKPGQVVCTVCRRIWNIRDQVHHRRVCHEGLPRPVDVADQIDRSTARHRFGSVYWQGRAERSLCSVHRKCHFSTVREIQAQCSQNAGDSQCLRGSRCWSGVWESYRRRHLLARGMNSVHARQDTC